MSSLSIIKCEAEDPEQGPNLRLFQVQKQIEYLKQLREKNLVLAAKLKEVKRKAISKMAHNDFLSKTFRHRRGKVGEQRSASIFGVSFYDFEVDHKIPKSLETYFELQVPKQKQSIFLKNVFQSTVQPELPLWLADSSIRLEQIVKGYPVKPSGIPFDRVGVFYGVSGLKVYELWRAERTKGELKKIPFTAEENNALLNMHQKYGDNWRHISKLTEFRSSQELYYQYNVINPGFKKGRWKLTQNLSLLILVEYYEIPNYHKMALKLKTRSEGQIRERFINVLNPQKRVKDWTDKETRTLLETAADFNYRWTKLSEQFQHKTDNEVWRKFRGVMSEKSYQDIQRFIFDDRIRKAVIEYKHKYKVQTRGLVSPRKQIKPN